MNKFILSGALVLVSFVASAQDFLSQSFLLQKSLLVSNTLTVSNLVNFAGQSNVFGVRWTNRSDVGISVTGAANYVKLIGDVELWARKDGDWWGPTFAASNGAITNAAHSPANVFVRLLTGGSGANAAVTFTFCPIWDDDETPAVGTTHNWSFAVTASTTTSVTIATNAPFYLWPGAKKLRLLSIVNGDTDASSQVWIDRISLNGYRP